MTAERPKVGVGIVVERADGRILLGRRVKPTEPETWCLPGGHLEPGETVEAAARRECLEESGLSDTTNAAGFVAVVDTGSAGGGVVFGVHARSGGVPAGPGEPHIFPEWVWVDPTDLPRPLFPASDALLRAWTGAEPDPAWQVLRVTAG
ncbi:8-oxo-dGTP diphosphatase [Rhodococcus sp. AG1013]|uniref:nucleotide triphosphate diphosphatase NUDT15 n=1 Tax=Rhodococcus sp. AG1013 TaxID=2183996 RepID=UPI000E0C1251|nr:NUDIX domain-containing protein [Rhodococcus sp. AG1013]RDI16728.1 8-oxo-dGTP diphosphatase [Rhodococcus sp. AG1013]